MKPVHIFHISKYFSDAVPSCKGLKQGDALSLLLLTLLYVVL